MNPLVTVVMPVFNGENFLDNSIRSFMEQTLKEIELIVVNDGSTDNTKAIVEKFATEDNRIQLINLEENRGNFFARKTGAMAATGDYIMFLDADDTLFLNACKQAWIQITKTEADIYQFGTKVVFPHDEFSGSDEKKVDKTLEISPVIQNLYKLLEPYDGILTGERILRGCYEQKLFSYTIWNKIYRRKTCQEGYNQIPDIYLNLGEDELAFFYISYYSKKYVGDPRLTLIYYTFGSGISTQQSVTLNHIQQLSRCLIIPGIIRKFLVEEGQLNYFKSSVDDIHNKYQDALFDRLFHYLINEDGSNKRKAFTSILEYCEPLALIKFLMPRFISNPSLVAEGLLDTDLAKPIKKPIKTIGTYYSRLRNGGAEKVISQLIPLWVELGYRVVLFTDEPPHDTDYMVDAAYTRVVLPPAKWDDYDAKATALDSALREYQVDVMIYHKWVDPHLLWDMLVCKQANCAFYIYAHSTIDFVRYVDLGSQKIYVQLPSIFKIADCVVTLTEMDTAFWKQFAHRVFQTSNPCTLPSGKTWNRKRHNNRILWTGRISEEKRPLELIRIFEIVLKKIPDAELCIVGTGEPDAIKQIIDYAKSKKILDRITLTGFQIEVNQFYEQSDIFLLTSAYEGFSMTTFEAQSHGLPIVMYELPYLALIKDNKGIIAVDQHAVEDAGKAIIEVLTNQEKYEYLSKEAYANAKRFSNIDIKEKWHQILSNPKDEKTEKSTKTSSESLRLALSSWTRFNIESLQKIHYQPIANAPQSPEPIASVAQNQDVSGIINLELQKMLVNMSIFDATVHLGKTLARRVLGKKLSDKIHLYRIRNKGK